MVIPAGDQYCFEGNRCLSLKFRTKADRNRVWTSSISSLGKNVIFGLEFVLYLVQTSWVPITPSTPGEVWSSLYAHFRASEPLLSVRYLLSNCFSAALVHIEWPLNQRPRPSATPVGPPRSINQSHSIHTSIFSFFVLTQQRDQSAQHTGELSARHLDYYIIFAACYFAAVTRSPLWTNQF